MDIHPSAIVESGVTLGADVRIGPFCYVQSGVQLGDGCQLGPLVTVLAHTVLGRHCRVHSGAVLGDLPQDYGYQDCVSNVRIGDDCILREGVTVHRGTHPGTETVIGDRCMLMANSHAAHNVRMGNDVILVNSALLGGYVSVGDRVFVSGNACVHQFARIGTMAMVGPNASITKDVPPFCTMRPSTENSVAGLNVVGMRRAGMRADARASVKTAFKMLYRSGLNVTQALAALDAGNPGPEVQQMIAFIRESKRGICDARFQ